MEIKQQIYSSKIEIGRIDYLLLPFDGGGENNNIIESNKEELLNYKLYQIIFNNKYLFNLIFSYIKSHNLLLKRKLLLLKSTRINIFKFNQLTSNWICTHGYYNLFVDKIRYDFHNNSNNSEKMMVTYKSIYLFSRYCKDFNSFCFIYSQFRDMIHSNYRVFDECCFNGSIKIIDFLNQRGVEGSIQAMDNAAISGRLDIVKYLHNNRSEGCSINAVDLASKNGYFEIVKFLLENRSEGCSYNALLYAASENHIEIVKYLLKNKKVYCDCLFADEIKFNTQLSYPILKLFLDYGYSISYLGDELPTYCYEEFADFDSIKLLCFQAIKDSSLNMGIILSSSKIYKNFTRSAIRSLINCSQFNHQNILLFLLSKLDLDAQLNSYIVSQCLDKAAVFGNFEMLNLLQSKFPSTYCTRLAVDQNNNPSGKDQYRFTKEFHKKQTKIVIHLYTKHLSQRGTYVCMDECAKYGNFKLLKWINENRKEGCSSVAFDNAILFGHSKILEYLLKNRKEGFSNTIIDKLLQEDKPEKVKFLIENNLKQPLPKHISYAVPQSLDFFIYLLSKVNNIFTPDAYVACIKFGDLEKFKYLYNLSLFIDETLPKITPELISVSARAGEIKFLQFIYTNNIVKDYGKVEKFMDSAASSGSLECVKLIHLHHPGYYVNCTESAIENASNHGHYNIIEYLLLNRKEGFREIALNNSIKNGDCEIFQLLVDHPISKKLCKLQYANLSCKFGFIEIIKVIEKIKGNGLFTPGAMDMAIGGGHLSILYYLQKNRTEGCSSIGFLSALESCKIPIIQFLAKNYPDFKEFSLIDDYSYSFLKLINSCL